MTLRGYPLAPVRELPPLAKKPGTFTSPTRHRAAGPQSQRPAERHTRTA